jgi:pimeloyl-ACP methyl ester carboxylesterase
MLRLILLLLPLCFAAAAPLPAAPPLHPSPAFTPAGPEQARGALVWLHGSYDAVGVPTPPAEQAWVARLARRGYDIWRFDRTPGQDPLIQGGEALLRGLAGLRHGGYRRVIVAGYSRGGFIALAALAHPDLVDALAAISPAAHGTRAERRAQAMSDFRDRLAAAAGPMRFALVQLDDDPFDPDADGRAAVAHEAVARAGLRLLLIDRPPAPRGHTGSDEPQFDAIFGKCLARFLDGAGGSEQSDCDAVGRPVP